MKENNSTIRIKKVLDVPIIGEPVQSISEGNPVHQVAVIGPDYHSMKPRIEVSIGDKVKTGDVLFVHRKHPDIRFTSPGCGRVAAFYRGEKRSFLSVVIDLEGEKETVFKSYTQKQIDKLDRETIVHQLLDSGLWTALRTRPYSHIALPDRSPHSIFVQSMDTQPLAPSVDVLLEDEEGFKTGLGILAGLTDGMVFVCKSPSSHIPVPDKDKIRVFSFSGPHPAGNVGTHIHFLDPVYREKEVWHARAHDVTAIGRLFLTGRIPLSRIVALSGSGIQKPRLIRTRIGASVKDITAGQCNKSMCRTISGSILNGHIAEGPLAYLGRYHQQITVIPETKERKFFGWLTPGWNLFSKEAVMASSLIPGKKFNMNTLMHGGERGIVPVGNYEKVMPLDILVTYVLRALAVNDMEEAERLGRLG